MSIKLGKTDMAKQLRVQKAPLHCPPMQEVAKVLENGLRETFKTVEVKVVECPDLTKKPYNLASPGLCGSPRIADVGGVPNLVPLVKRDKIYNLEKVADLAELPGALLVGAGAGPHHVFGRNAEMIANLKTSENKDIVNKTHICSIEEQSGQYKLGQLPTTDFCLLANLFISEGKPGKVLQVRAEHRIGKDNIMSSLRKTLAKHYGSEPVALGGMFCVEEGNIRTHVMPDFSSVPLDSDDDVDNWLRFFEMSGPFTCVGTLISQDPGLDLRMEHFHGYNERGQGGHYHYDTTPEVIRYLGYFNIAEYMYRIDPPEVTHMIGRD